MKAQSKQAAAPREQPRGIDSQMDRLARHLARDPGCSSNYGAQCERMQVLGHTSRKCPKCDGLGFREVDKKELAERAVRLYRCTDPDEAAQLRERLSHESTCQTCRGTGYIEGSKVKGERKPFFTTKRCFKCKGCGEVMNEDLEDVCQRCMGEMCVVTVTVQETGCSKGGKAPRREPDDADDFGGDTTAPRNAGAPAGGPTYSDGVWRELTYGADINEAEFLEHGSMSRLLVRLQKHDEVSAEVLKAYLGPEGDRWGPTKWGRHFVVWPLTKPGAQLAREAAQRSKAGHGFLLTPMQLLASERDAEQKTGVPNMRRRHLINQAELVSRGLVEAAKAALREVLK